MSESVESSIVSMIDIASKIIHGQVRERDIDAIVILKETLQEVLQDIKGKKIQRDIYYLLGLAYSKKNSTLLYDVYLSTKYFNKYLFLVESGESFRFAIHQIYDLANQFDDELSVKQDLHMSKCLYEICANSDHTEAKCKLGEYYLNGKCVNKDINIAINFFKDSNTLMAHNNMYALAKTLKKQDTKKALDLLKFCSDNGHVDSLNELGTMYSLGQGVNIDVDYALKHYLKSMNPDSREKIYDLGR